MEIEEEAEALAAGADVLVVEAGVLVEAEMRGSHQRGR